MRCYLLIALCVLSLFSCTQAKHSDQSKLNLVVASSVGLAATELANASSDLRVTVQSGASSVIARQIVGGMHCDVVILADNEWMDYLSRNGRIEDGSRKPFLGNRLVWIISAKSNMKVEDSRRIAIADPTHVPLGKYAKTLLSSLGIWNQISKRVVAAPDARTALFWVEAGEADSAVVYETDALSSRKVKIARRFEEDASNPILYPIAKCKSGHPQKSKLYDRLTVGDGTEIFRKHGFHLVMPANERV